MNRSRQSWTPLLVLFLAVGIFAAVVRWQGSHPVIRPDTEMLVVPPPSAQVVLAGGDRYLAANVAVVRSLLNPLRDDGYDRFRAQAKAQFDASLLNPRHEDNYYVAAAMLSWSGHVEEAEFVLRRAAEGRPFDMLPPLYLGFDYFYFDHDPVQGSHWMYQAAQRADSEQNRTALSRIASRWLERGQDAREALRILAAMQSQAHGLALKQYLAQRAERLQVLATLQDGAGTYRSRNGRPLSDLDELVRSGILAKLPVDPAGLGFDLDASGMPQLRQPPLKGPPPLRQQSTGNRTP